jgi:hypothetical protein
LLDDEIRKRKREESDDCVEDQYHPTGHSFGEKKNLLHGCV